MRAAASTHDIGHAAPFRPTPHAWPGAHLTEVSTNRAMVPVRLCSFRHAGLPRPGRCCFDCRFVRPLAAGRPPPSSAWSL